MKEKRYAGMVLMFVCAVFWLLSPVALAATKVSYCASWLIYGRDAPLAAALDRGIFKAEGLDLTLHRGYGSADTFKKVGIGTCTYGDAAAGAAALGRIKGIKAKEIAMSGGTLFQETNYYFAESGIKTPKDIEGKRITGGTKASSDILLWPTFAKANGIDTSKVKVVYMVPSAKIASLATGKVDLVISFHDLVLIFQKVARKQGKNLVVQLWADHGVDIYGNGLTASDETISKRKDTTMRFVRAYYKAFRWAFRNREAAVDMFLKHYPEQNRAGALNAQNLFFLHFFDKNTDKVGLGHMEREKMAKTIRITLGASGIKEKLDPSDLYTNEFVDKMPDDLRFFYKQ